MAVEKASLCVEGSPYSNYSHFSGWSVLTTKRNVLVRNVFTDLHNRAVDQVFSGTTARDKLALEAQDSYPGARTYTMNTAESKALNIYFHGKRDSQQRKALRTFNLYSRNMTPA